MNEHDPIHVHVKKGDKETIFELIVYNGVLTEVRQRKRRKVELLSTTDAQKAMAFIQHYYKDILQKWVDVFVLKKEIRKITITKKIRHNEKK
jgi:uncharacterized protein (DUF849 family)